MSKEFREVATPILKKLLDKCVKVVEYIKGDFIVEGRSVSFLCPENYQRLSVVFRTKKGIMSGKRSLPFTDLKTVSVRSLIGVRDYTSNCVSRLKEGGFELLYNKLPADNLYMLDAEFEITKPDFMRNLVDKDYIRESPDPEKYKRWIQAQLKFTDILERFFSDVRFEELDFTVPVSVYDDVNTSIPRIFRREIDLLAKLARETDRNKRHILEIEHGKLLRQRQGGRKSTKDVLSVLAEIQEVFLPSKFRKFVKVEEEFWYHDCFRGSDYLAAPFPTYPKTMTVVARTNLNLNKPASKGFMEYYHKDFRDEMEKILSKYL